MSALPSSLIVTTLNVNGLRSALRKGLLAWLAQHQPDVVLMQEVRAPALPEVVLPLGYQSCWHAAQRPGYSGVAILSRLPISEVTLGFGDPLIDAEGRLIAATIAGVRFASVYLPSGTSGGARQAFKEQVMADFARWVQQQLQPSTEQPITEQLSAEQSSNRPLVLGGDFNVAHSELDIKNWRGNQKNSGFLPHERQWLTDLLRLGLRDHHREHLGAAQEYTWWSNRANAYANNVGWRIDYLLSSGAEMERVWVDRDIRLSDHAPLTGTLLRGS